MTPKPQQKCWASQEAAIKAEINEAKNTSDLLRMANAIVQLDALQSEMEAGRTRAPQYQEHGTYTALAPDRFKGFWKD